MSAARRRRVRSLAVLLGASSDALTTTAGALPAPARASGHAGEPRSIAVEGGVTQPLFSYEKAVREHQEVRSTLDGDGATTASSPATRGRGRDTSGRNRSSTSGSHADPLPYTEFDGKESVPCAHT